MKGQMFLIAAIFFSAALLFILKPILSPPILEFKASYYLENCAREYNKLLVHCSLYGNCPDKLENFSRFLSSRLPVRIVYLLLEENKGYLGNFYDTSINLSLSLCNRTIFLSIEPSSTQKLEIRNCGNLTLTFLGKSLNFSANRNRTLFLYLETEAKDKFFVDIY